MNNKRSFHLHISNWDVARTNRPSLETERLLLRPFNLNDSQRVQKLANCKEVTSPTLNLPFPYKIQHAQKWISTHDSLFTKKKHAIFAITDRISSELLGAISLVTVSKHSHAELGYWVGHDYWKQGFATEAARGVIEFGFEKLELNRIYAHFMAHNPASGKVMKKLGMHFEGILREHVFKNDTFIDLHIYSILKSEWDANSIK
ncbi:MAG: N-acetyltransferase [Calditrichaeota bacterium]|nr:MAG: N-acetyltransferase [Calditrichota bacterium]